ncbi:MAG: efflux transporter periplasmic adaptor subunit [Hyphomicrobiales bacterium]|nr:efflux transporter periplasmic adaptor subunit [Hyphomicrobiales bacterium]
MKRRLVVSIVFLLVVVLCGGLIWFNFFKAKMITQFFANMQPPAQVVSSTTVESKTWNPTIPAIGTSRAWNGVELAVQVGGLLKKIYFKPNQRYKQGDLLLQIDDTVDQADLANALAAVKLNEANFDRSKTLASRGYASDATLDQVASQLATARAQEARARAVIDLKALKAPFPGVAGISRVDEGQYLQAGTSVATYQNLDAMRVDFTVPEQSADSVKPDQDVRVGTKEGDLPFAGKIIGVDPRVDPKTRLVSVQALIPDNKDKGILPGQFLQVEVLLPPQANVLTVPQTAVITSLYGDYVFTIEDQDKDGVKSLVARQVFVKTGRRQQGSMEIVSGIQAGQKVIASGQNKVQAGATVKIDNSIDITKFNPDNLQSVR